MNSLQLEYVFEISIKRKATSNILHSFRLSRSPSVCSRLFLVLLVIPIQFCDPVDFKSKTCVVEKNCFASFGVHKLVPDALPLHPKSLIVVVVFFRFVVSLLYWSLQT